MSNKTQLQTNNTNLDALITRVNAAKDTAASLPEAGSGAGDGNIELCTLSTGEQHKNPTSFTVTTYENNEINSYIIDNICTPNTIISDKIVKNSTIAADYSANMQNNLELLMNNGYTIYTYKVLGDAIFNSYPCFVYGTPIKLAKGTTKPVQDITYQDSLLVWDFDNGCYSSAKPLWIKKAQTATYYYHCEFENGIILDLVGANGKCHRIFSLDDNRFESATDCVGKMVMTEQGASKLVSCDRIDEAVEYYNIITDYHMNLYANSVLASCKLNNLYPIRDMKFVKEDRESVLFEAFEGVEINFYRGLRLSEQTMPVEELENYIQNLYRLRQI